MSAEVRSAVLLAALLWSAGLAYTLPLERRPRYWAWMAAGLPAFQLLLQAALRLGLLWTGGVWLLGFGAQVLLVRAATKQSWPGAVYCSVWSILTAQTVFELWTLTSLFVSEELLPLWRSLWPVRALCAGGLYLVLLFTLARWMPTGHSYRVGPRQLTSACLLGVLFTALFGFFRGAAAGEDRRFLLLALLCQFYCLTLLYLQTELFKKSAMQKEMDTLNLLYERQRQQYRTAKHNIQLINHKCHQLKLQMAELRKLAPDEATRVTLREVEDAVRIYDANMDTGSEVLDVVLTEKSLNCESSGVQMNCVADGRCLDFMEPGDLYALFANILDNALEATALLPDRQKRMIDLLVCRRQSFSVVSLINPLAAPLEFSDGLPLTTKKQGGYDLKLVRRIVQKYGGVLEVDARDGFFALKAVFPAQTK